MSKAQVVLVVGAALITIGLYLASNSGLFFGSYVCYGGLACGNTYELLRLELWEGVVTLSFGIGLTIFGSFLSRRRMKESSVIRDATEGENHP